MVLAKLASTFTTEEFVPASVTKFRTHRVIPANGPFPQTSPVSGVTKPARRVFPAIFGTEIFALQAPNFVDLEPVFIQC